ncbi:hypothetical protein P4O66_015381 [Electrophorus voltai]|uniref:Resistance to inhibitors of cholinesterase protein 3 N-terminal domain-containing protein n=2 Tax=Electrophorus TaxID=8004 RepID=A0A4W4F7Y3_ELEEL|nr:coiled-coil domain-containing protein 107 [Electrophorus electricus]KAK1789465.1 hypothetical protein P4O66_015381 [Electrophorus voltai]
MVLSSSQQIVVAFTAVVCVFVVFPRLFGGGGVVRETKTFEPRYRKGPGPNLGPGAVKSKQVSAAAFQGQSAENMQQVQHVKKLMEQELKSDKYKSSNKGYVITLMPLYAIGVGIFAAYKFLKIKFADDSQAQKEKTVQGIQKSEETENQLNELEKRLAQTERMLNSILTQLDPLTNCVKSVAMEQKNEIMSQLQCIRHLMKKRGMECPPINTAEASCERNLDNLIESLSAMEYLGGTSVKPQTPITERTYPQKRSEQELERGPEGQDKQEADEGDEEEVDGGGNDESDSSMPSLEELEGSSMEDEGMVLTAQEERGVGLRRRYRPD